MRASLLATELARRAGLDQVRQGEVYYGTLLRFVGCAATSHEIAAALGSDDSRRHLPAGPTLSGDRLDAPGRHGVMHHGGQGGKRGVMREPDAIPERLSCSGSARRRERAAHPPHSLATAVEEDP